MFSGTFKDVFTNIVGLIMVLGGAINAYLQQVGTGSVNWFQLLIAVGAAVVAYFTGKDGKGAAKAPGAQ